MAILTKDQILAAEDLPRQTVTVDEWGGDVIIRSLTAAERDAWEAGFIDDSSKKVKIKYTNAKASLVARCAVGEDGIRLFTDEEVAELGRKSAKAVNRLYDVARELSGLSTEDIEELEKN